MSRSLGHGLLLAIGALALASGCKNRSNRPGDILTCTPGEALTIGCTGNVGSVCEGDPVMDACDGGTTTPSVCTDSNAIASNDDWMSGSLCPLVHTTCPTSGRITVSVHGFGTSSFACYWDIVHGAGPMTDASTGGGGG